MTTNRRTPASRPFLDLSNPRPKPIARETKYMNSRLRDDTNFWWGYIAGLLTVLVILWAASLLWFLV